MPMMMMVIVMSCQQLNVYHSVIMINFDGERVCSPSGVLTSFSCMPLQMEHCCYLLNNSLPVWNMTADRCTFELQHINPLNAREMHQASNLGHSQMHVIRLWGWGALFYYFVASRNQSRDNSKSSTRLLTETRQLSAHIIFWYANMDEEEAMIVQPI